jgi:hypothetical protein
MEGLIMKPTTIGSKADHSEDWVRFKREHTGKLVSSGPAFVALWPILVAGLAFLVFGALLITRAANSGVALGGVCLALIGLAFITAFFWLMRRDHDS